MSKRRGFSLYIRILALVLAVAGLAALLLSNSISAANRLSNAAGLMLCALLGLVFLLCSLFVSRLGRAGEILETVSIIAAVVLLSIVMVNQIGGRILMISGLFTWNSMNLEGWRVFYFMIASCILLLASNLLQIAAAFMKTNKEQA